MKTYLIKLVIILNFCLISTLVKAEVKEYHYIWVDNPNIFNKECEQCNISQKIYYLGKLVIDYNKKKCNFECAETKKNVNNELYNFNKIIKKILNAMSYLKENNLCYESNVDKVFEDNFYLTPNVYIIPNSLGDDFFTDSKIILNESDIKYLIIDNNCRLCYSKVRVTTKQKNIPVKIILPK